MVLDSILTAVMLWSKDQWIFESSRESEQPTLTTLAKFVAYGAVTIYIPWNFNGHKLRHFRSVSQCGPSDLLNMKLWEQKWQSNQVFKYKTYWICHLLKDRGIITSFSSMNMIRTNDQIVPRAKTFQTISRNNVCKNKESVHLCEISWFNAQMLFEWILPFSCWGYEYATCMDILPNSTCDPIWGKFWSSSMCWKLSRTPASSHARARTAGMTGWKRCGNRHDQCNAGTSSKAERHGMIQNSIR